MLASHNESSLATTPVEDTDGSFWTVLLLTSPRPGDFCHKGGGGGSSAVISPVNDSTLCLGVEDHRARSL